MVLYMPSSLVLTDEHEYIERSNRQLVLECTNCFGGAVAAWISIRLSLVISR